MNLKLSDVPSEALLQALADLEAAEQDDRYVVDMGSWHAPARLLRWLIDEEKIGDKCFVCLAGSVLRARTDLGPQDDVLIGTLPNPVQNKLLALDYFRMGRLNDGMRQWFYDKWYNDDFERVIVDDDYTIPHYDYDKEGFKAGVRNVAARLKAAGY